MKIIKYKFIWIFLLSATVLFGQKSERKIEEKFNVDKNAVIEITTRYTDVTIETWNKNVVSIKGVWEVEGMTKEEAENYFKDWNFEALANKDKVVVTSKDKNSHQLPKGFFEGLDFDFDSIAFIGNLVEGDFFAQAPPIPTTPELPEPFIEHLSEVEFDHEAYEKDKEGYMKKFEKKMEEWSKEFEEKIEPKMKEFEEKMAKWEKENAPKMKEFEERMKKWEKENGKKMKELEKRAAKMEKERKEKYVAILVDGKNKNSQKIKKSLLIKIPKSAKVKIDAKFGKFIFPDDMNTVD